MRVERLRLGFKDTSSVLPGVSGPRAGVSGQGVTKPIQTCELLALSETRAKVLVLEIRTTTGTIDIIVFSI